MPLGVAPDAKPLDGNIARVDGDPRKRCQRARLVFSEKPRQVGRAGRVLFDHIHVVAHRLVVMPIGFRPTFTVVGVPSVLSLLIGKIVIPPGPGFAGVYSSVPLALFW